MVTVWFGCEGMLCGYNGGQGVYLCVCGGGNVII